jgi:hypothetical protein
MMLQSKISSLSARHVCRTAPQEVETRSASLVLALSLTAFPFQGQCSIIIPESPVPL